MSDNVTLADQSEIPEKLQKPKLKNIYCIKQPNPQHHLFVMKKSHIGYQYYLIVDDDTFPSEMVTLKAPEALRPLTQIRLLNCVKGYQCFFGHVNEETMRFVMWNPSSNVPPIDIDIAKTKYKRIVVGCGTCPVTDDMKLVKLCFKDLTLSKADDLTLSKTNTISKVDAVDVSVCTISKPVWRVERKPVWSVKRTRIFASRTMECGKVCINGVIYFRAFDLEKERSNYFKAFDLTSEEFKEGEVYLPMGKSYTRDFIQSANVNGSLGLLDYHGGVCEVWTKADDPSEFTKLHTITDTVKGMCCFGGGDLLEFTKNGKAVVELRGFEGSKIGVFDPVSKKITASDLGIDGEHGTFFVKRYKATTYH